MGPALTSVCCPVVLEGAGGSDITWSPCLAGTRTVEATKTAWNPSLLFFRSHTQQTLACKPALSLALSSYPVQEETPISANFVFVLEISLSPGWPQTLHIAKDDLKLPTFLSLPTEFWDYRCVSPHWLVLLSFL